MLPFTKVSNNDPEPIDLSMKSKKSPKIYTSSSSSSLFQTSDSLKSDYLQDLTKSRLYILSNFGHNSNLIHDKAQDIKGCSESKTQEAEYVVPSLVNSPIRHPSDPLPSFQTSQFCPNHLPAIVKNLENNKQNLFQTNRKKIADKSPSDINKSEGLKQKLFSEALMVSTTSSHIIKRTRYFRIYPCHQCTESFPTQDRLTYHTHACHKYFRCPFCGQMLTRWSNLRRHILLCRDLKPYICEICRRDYSRRDHIIKHIKSCHSESTTDPRLNIFIHPNLEQWLQVIDLVLLRKLPEK